MIKSFTALQAWLVTRLKADDGATMVEYGLMLALIAIVCLVSVTLIGTNANAMFNTIAGSI